MARDKHGRSLFTARVASGIKVARACHRAVVRNVGTFRADANRIAQAEALREPK